MELGIIQLLNHTGQNIAMSHAEDVAEALAFCYEHWKVGRVHQVVLKDLSCAYTLDDTSLPWSKVAHKIAAWLADVHQGKEEHLVSDGVVSDLRRQLESEQRRSAALHVAHTEVQTKLAGLEALHKVMLEKPGAGYTQVPSALLNELRQLDNKWSVHGAKPTLLQDAGTLLEKLRPYYPKPEDMRIVCFLAWLKRTGRDKVSTTHDGVRFTDPMTEVLFGAWEDLHEEGDTSHQ